MSFSGPFRKLELSHEHGAEPPAIAHLLFRQSLPKSPAVCFRKVQEGTVGDFQFLELREQPTSCSGREAAARPGDIHQLLAIVISEYEGVQWIPDCVPADDELLTLVDPH